MSQYWEVLYVAAVVRSCVIACLDLVANSLVFGVFSFYLWSLARFEPIFLHIFTKKFFSTSGNWTWIWLLWQLNWRIDLDCKWQISNPVTYIPIPISFSPTQCKKMFQRLGSKWFISYSSYDSFTLYAFLAADCGRQLHFCRDRKFPISALTQVHCRICRPMRRAWMSLLVSLK